MTKKELVKKEENLPAMPEDLQGAWGAEDVAAEDILIPRILLMQPISERVGSGECSAGDILKSTDGSVLAPFTKGGSDGVEIIPLKTFRTWRIMELRNGKYEYAGMEPITSDNVNDPYEWQVDNQMFRRDRMINYYVLLTSEIKKEIAALKKLKEGDMPDAEDCLIPCLLSFTRTSAPAGKQLATFFKKAQHFKVPPASSVFRLYSEFEKNDKGNYYVFKLENARKTELEELKMAKHWYDTLKEANVKIDDSDDDQGPTSEQLDDINDTF